MRFYASALSLVAALVLAVSCAHAPAASASGERQLEAALQRYAQRVVAMDPPGIAALFAPDGEIVNPGQPSIVGRAAIEAFLAGFSNYHVLEDDLRPESAVVERDRATQTGTYHQRVRTPEGKLLEVSGHFQAEWVRDGEGHWLIQRMGTTPN